ncbi:uncharacterized protein [Henckelia pumila]|uniref:uncharacterized protein isoform X2 n=1 Tax=Henckelia pumila TaxID=405737 RepID=UPI003C6E1FC7
MIAKTWTSSEFNDGIIFMGCSQSSILKYIYIGQSVKFCVSWDLFSVAAGFFHTVFGEELLVESSCWILSCCCWGCIGCYELALCVEIGRPWLIFFIFLVKFWGKDFFKQDWRSRGKIQIFQYILMKWIFCFFFIGNYSLSAWVLQQPRCRKYGWNQVCRYLEHDVGQKVLHLKLMHIIEFGSGGVVLFTISLALYKRQGICINGLCHGASYVQFLYLRCSS